MPKTPQIFKNEALSIFINLVIEASNEVFEGTAIPNLPVEFAGFSILTPFLQIFVARPPLFQG
ncbi:hypothetical protein AFM12_07625 [Jiulongibacter sediminis]|uniref:Uncharacterized protein n=1 Tax=Jiulongibacter sediminis TaxID=1605367 RepID=A0A0P7BML3_9BACT|nr:hypothetical protein AFM12_07625 [Jiulongibacter sediminis]TBX25027.1 hypothetical protein TK44_07630 [Jiulongibacter sediminis]